MQFPIRDLESTLLRAFVSVVDSGSFVRAADRLNRTQSALSMQIKRLEEMLNAELFDRTVRPPQLTIAGEKLVAYAREIISLNDSALEDIRASEVAGAVRLGIMEDLAVTHLSPVVHTLRSEYPLVRVDVETGLTASFVDELGIGFDIVVAMTSTDHKEGDLLFRGRSCWVSSPEYNITEADEIQLALSRSQCLFRKWATSALERAGRRWHIGLVSTSIAAISSYIADGRSVSVMKDVTIPPYLVEVGQEAGLPSLPDYEIRLIRSAAGQRGPYKALADKLCERIPEVLASQKLCKRSDLRVHAV